jgi:hypothetical protein
MPVPAGHAALEILDRWPRADDFRVEVVLGT